MGSKNKLNALRFRWSFILLMGIVVAGIAGLLWFTPDSEEDRSAGDVTILCSNPDFLPSIDPTATYEITGSSKLTTVKQKILEAPNYDQDASCLYFLTVFSIDAGKAGDARGYFDKLKNSGSDPFATYKNVAGQNSVTINELEAMINYLQARAERASNNGVTFGEPE